MEPHSLNDWQFDQADHHNTTNEVKSSTLPRVYPGVPKNRPPAKPPRRKLSYPSESTTHTSSTDSLVSSGKEKDSDKTQPQLTQCQSSKINGCAHSTKSESSTPFHESSDYGSLPGADFWSRMCFTDRQKYHMLGHLTSEGTSTVHPRLCSTPNSGTSEHFFCMPSWHAFRKSPNSSLYFTPPCTPRHPRAMPRFSPKDVCKCMDGSCCNESTAKDQGGVVESPMAVPKHRRHHSDPQIMPEQKASTKMYCKRSKSQRGESFVGPSLQECHNFLEAAVTEPTILMEELVMLREICGKLWHQLQEAQAKIERLQNSQSMNAQIDKPYFSELLSQVYYAQKERDQAVWARIDLAHKERQQAVRQLEQLKQVLSRHNLKEVYSSDDEDEEMNTDRGIDKVLENIEQTNSPAKLLQHRETLLTSITRVRDQKHHRILQELKAVLADRDDAVAKALMLQEELEHLLKAKSIWDKSPSNWSIMTTLQKAREERDQAISQVEHVKQQLDLHRRLSSFSVEKEKSPAEMCKGSFVACRTQSFKEKRHESENQVNSFSSLPMLNLSAGEENLASGESQKLQQERQCRQEAEEKCKKLERLVDVLRKKMSGLSVGMPV